MTNANGLVESTSASAYIFAKAAVSSEGQPITGTVRIGAPDGFGSVFLAPRVRALTDRHPQLEIEILPSARLFSLLKREADIAIGLSSPEHMRVLSRRLTDHRLYIYASRAYLKEAAPIASRPVQKDRSVWPRQGTRYLS